MNESGIHPCGHRILVQPEEVEEVTKSGIVIAAAATMKEQQAQIVATVIEIGPGAWQDTTSSEWAEVGDLVYIGKFAGLVFKGKDGKTYRVLNDLDIVATIEP